MLPSYDEQLLNEGGAVHATPGLPTSGKYYCTGETPLSTQDRDGIEVD